MACPARRGCFLLALLALPLLASAPAQAQNYPRLAFYGAIHRNGLPLYDSNGALISPVADAIARFQEVILDLDPITPYFPGFLPAMRARNPQIQMLAYVTGHYIWYSADPDSFNHYPTRYWRTVRDLDGFLYNKQGQLFGLTNSAFADVNMAKKDKLGHYVVAESLATLFWDVAIRKGGWNGVFVDTFCDGILWAQAPAESIDFARAGYSSASSFNTAWKAGTDTLASRLRKLSGAARVLVGNCAMGTKYTTFNGWMRENFPYQDGGSWTSNMFNDPGGYFVDEARFMAPRNNHISSSVSSTLPFSTDNYRRVRFGLGSAALGNGYASFVPGQRSADVPYYGWWYDEFGVDLATGTSSGAAASAGWLGQPLAPYYQMIWVGTNPDAVTNPSVETDLSGWSLYHDSGVAATLTRDTTTAAVGRASVKVKVPNAGSVAWSTALFSTGSIQTWASVTYSATFWAKAAVPRSVMVVATASGGGEVARATVNLGTSWQQYQVGLVPTGNTQSKLGFYLAGSAGDVWIDDAHFQMGTTTIYRRDFWHGIVLVNPGTTNLTVPLSRPYQKILGLHDLITNDGVDYVTSVTVKAWDALFLLDPGSLASVSGPAPAPRVTLQAPLPNPWHGGALTLRLTLPRGEAARLELYDPLGRRVAARDEERLGAGFHALSWDPGRLSPGLYFLRLAAGSESATAKCVMLE